MKEIKNRPIVYVSDLGDIGFKQCREGRKHCFSAYCACGFEGKINGIASPKRTAEFWYDYEQETAKALYESMHDL